jgi:pimeloyl-ACP methyl ester carboxylesterase
MRITVNSHSNYVYLGKADSHAEISADKPSIFFIHGAQLDHSCWALQSRWFAHHGFNTFAPDLPGHGLSEGDPLSSVNELAGWVCDLLDALQLGEVYLVGHSMGSLIALEIALKFRARVKKLILIATSAPMPVSEVLLDAAKNEQGKAVSMVNNFSHSSQAQMGRNSVPGMWMLGANQRLMERQKEGVFFTDLTACNNYSIDAALLKELKLATLIVCGDEDKMISAKSSRKLAEQINDSQLKVLKGAGHALMAEAPDEVLACLIEFTN